MSEIKTWRTLIRVEKVGKAIIYIVIPAINSTKQWMVNKRNLPFTVKNGQRIFAKANLKAEHEPELRLSDWENPK